MLFNSLPFLVFLAASFLLYWALPRRGQNALLVFASYVFYGWWDWRFLSLIALSSAVDFIAGRQIAGATDRVRQRRGWLALSLGVNLGTLGVFKYLDFGIASLAALLRGFGFEPSLPVLGLVLPIGISFYTFQTLSYTLDVYAGRLRHTDDAIAFFAFVAFFPQLVAGPIERAATMLPQFLAPRRFVPQLAVDGCRQMLYGFVLKAVVADRLAEYVDVFYAEPGAASGWALLFATYFFALQIYCDFAGYSHIAIGCARLFGLQLRRNFAYPYFAQSPVELWRRWHISLSTWFRDYVYIPLGGSRVSAARRAFNTMLTFVLSGAWHGAGATFLIWGALHGVAVVLQGKAKALPTSPGGEGLFPRPAALLRMLAMFHGVCFAWIFFRARSVPDALLVVERIGHSMFNGEVPVAPPTLHACLALGLLGVEWARRRHPHPLHQLPGPRWARWALYVTLVASIAVLGTVDEVPFLYFQF